MTETVNFQQSFIETTKRYSSLFEIHMFKCYHASGEAVL